MLRIQPVDATHALNLSAGVLNPGVENMTYSMNRMTWIMDLRMGEMTNEMDQMGDKFSPSGMMPYNW